LEYYKLCVSMARNKEKHQNTKKKGFFSDPTDIGIIVTLHNTLKLMEFLGKPEIGFSYLLTARLNQDAIEVNFH